jgi:ribosome biogenesis GTPase A
MNIQWFPGHMAKTRRLLSENLKLIDVVIELLDARIPKSSKNPEIDTIINNKARVVILNKSDLADSQVLTEWVKWYKHKGSPVIPVDSIKGTGIKQLKDALKFLMKERIERDRQRGRIFRPIRTMIVGIPNVGKSALINKIAGKAVAVTGDRPGVTRSKQWIRINPEIELLDTPGILWPKFDDPVVARNLAYTGAIKDEIMDVVELSALLAKELSLSYKTQFEKRYKLTDTDSMTGYQLLEAAGRKRGCILSGGEIDYNRIAVILLDEFRGGKIGRISLERPVWEGGEN